VTNAAWADAVLRNALALRDEDRVEFLAQCHAAGPGLRQDVEDLLRLAEHGAPGVELGEISPAFLWSVLSRSESPAAGREPDASDLAAAALEPPAVPAPPFPAESPFSEPAQLASAEDELTLGEWTITGELPPRGTGRLVAVERDAGSVRGVARILPVPATPDCARLFGVLCERLAAAGHPRLAALLDYGTSAGGAFYLVHEAAEGRTLSRYCARQRIGIQDRVRLMIRLCGVIQDAHRSLIAHGALTDSRILVDDHGELTIVDCGVEPLAASIADASNDRRAGALAAAGDVRQAGVLLRDLVLPRSVSANARLDAELASIVEFATRPDGPDRYRSMGALRSDLQRWLERRPLLARGDARSYRLERFIVRRRVPLMIGAAAGLAAAILLPAVIANRDRTTREAARADAVARMVAAVVDSRTSSVSAGPPEARTYVDRAAAVVRAELAAQPAQQSTMLLAVGRAYNDLGAYASSIEALEEALRLRRATYGDDATEVADVLVPLGQARAALGRYDEAESALRMARAIRILRAGAGQPAPGMVNVELAGLLHRLGRTDEPALLLRAQLATSGPPAASPPAVQDDLTARARVTLAGVLRDHGHSTDAEALYRQVLSSLAPARETPGSAPEPRHLWKNAASKDIERARAQVGLAGLLISRGDTDEPAALLIDALQALRRLYGPDHPALLEALRAQGRLRLAQQRLPEAHAAVEEAQRIQQDSLGVFTLDVPANGVLQAELALRDGRAADAVAASRLVLDELERLELGDHPLTIDARAALGEALTALGRGEEAIPVLSRAITTAESWIAGDDHRTLRLRGALAGAQTSAARRSR
jgi:tetratricopeptide (TPR) repeat protein